jgi:predicted metal-dependent hydrolase
MKTTFKETIVLSEARNPDLTYSEKVVKNKIDRVTVELAGNPSGVMSRLTSRYDRLDKAIKTMTVKRNEMNEQIKENVTELFNAEDIVLTRVVETISFTLTLSKLVKSSEQNPKTTVDYEAIAKELAKLIPEELQEQVEAITKMYTEVTITADKSPALRIKNKNDKLDEGLMDSIKGLANKVVKWAKSMASWAVGYDKKLAALKAKAGK